MEGVYGYLEFIMERYDSAMAVAGMKIAQYCMHAEYHRLIFTLTNFASFYNNSLSCCKYLFSFTKIDPRTKNWLLVGKPWPTLTIVFGYLLFVKYGKQYMETRAALSLKYLMMFYNFGLVLLSFYISSEVCTEIKHYYYALLK